MLTEVEKAIIERAEADAQADAADTQARADTKTVFHLRNARWNVQPGRCYNARALESTVEYMQRHNLKRAKVQDYD